MADTASLEVTVHGPDGPMEKYRLAGPQSIVIGRDVECLVVLPSPEVSRRHAMIAYEPDGVRVTDLSANGTMVADQLVSRATVAVTPPTDIRIGPFVVRLKMGVAVDPPHLDVPPTELKEKSEPLKPSVRVPVAVRRDIHRRLLDNLDLVEMDKGRMNDKRLRTKVKVALEEITTEVAGSIPAGTDIEKLIEELTDEALGLGPLEQLLADDAVTEIMVVDPQTIFVERAGRVIKTDLHFTDDDSVRSILERIVSPLGRRIDESSPLVDARLKDGSRVNAVIPPLAVNGTCITIRKFSKKPFTVDDIVKFGTFNHRMATFLMRSVIVRKNILISGGTGSGKTTLLNLLSSSIPKHERIVTIEDAAELQLQQPHVVTLEARPANMEGRGEVSIRDLVKNAMRMRPDRILVGESRSGEALDMLQAMNTGHEGSMTTTHANTPVEALKRIETLALMGGLDLPARAIREQIAVSIHLVVQQNRMSDGSRKITSITEVVGLNDDGEIETREIFGYRRRGTTDDGKLVGEFFSTGYLPTFLDDFITHGLCKEGEYL